MLKFDSFATHHVSFTFRCIIRCCNNKQKEQ